jgi:hypothetical protein
MTVSCYRDDALVASSVTLTSPPHSALVRASATGAGPVAPATIIPLDAGPTDDPSGWARATARGPERLAVLRLPEPDLDGSHPARWTRTADAVVSLLIAGARPLGHISLGYAARDIAAVAADLDRWAALPVMGIFFDHAPAGTYHIGPVALAVRMARRIGLETVVLNPGVPVDPVYRRLDATFCTFEGSWRDYQDRPAADNEPGDGHLVYDTPRADWDAARALATARGAGLLLVTDAAQVILSAAAGSAGTNTTTGS